MLFLNRKSEQGMQPSQGSVAEALAWGGDHYRPAREAMIETQAAASKRMCASAECASTRISPWRNRKRPIFEDQWSCSGRCMLSVVRSAVRRETIDGDGALPLQHRHRLPLGLLMLAQGWITQSQLRYALEVQKVHGGRIGDCLISECGVEPERVTRALGMQWSCPVLAARGFSPQAMSIVVPKTFVEEFGFVPLRVAGSKLLYLGFEDRLDASAALALEQMTDLKVESGLVPTEEYREIRRSLMEQEGVPVRMEFVDEADALAARITALLEQKQPVASRLVRMHKYLWFRMWLESPSTNRKGSMPRDRDDMIDYVFSVGR